MDIPNRDLDTHAGHKEDSIESLDREREILLNDHFRHSSFDSRVTLSCLLTCI